MTQWNDVFDNADELAAALDVHSALLARKFGDYSMAADIRMAAEALRDLADRIEIAAFKAEQLQKAVEDTQATAQALLAASARLQ